MDRGVRLDRTYQLNFGGNTDFLNMLERERLESKKISKTNAVTSMLDYELDDDDIHVGPSDHVPWLKDRKWCYIRMEGTTYGDVPLNVELKLEVWDSPNSAGVITDAIRCLKLGLDRGLAGTLVAPSSYFMKSPPQQIHDDIAFNRVEAFIRGEDNETLVGTEAPKKRTLPQARGFEGQGGRRREVTGGERRLEAPHRRGGASPRIVERSVVLAYRATAWVLRTVPARPAGALIGLGAQASYLLWPTKRTWSNRNFGHVLGLPPDHPRVRRLALRAYRVYGDYLVELMRVPFMPTDEVVELIEPLDADEIARIRATAPDRRDHLHRRPHRQQRRDRRRPSPTSACR